jgi:hypothetical protein
VVRAVIVVMRGYVDRSLLKADSVCSVSAARREPKARPAVSDRRLEALIQEREAEVPVPPFSALSGRPPGWGPGGNRVGRRGSCSAPTDCRCAYRGRTASRAALRPLRQCHWPAVAGGGASGSAPHHIRDGIARLQEEAEKASGAPICRGPLRPVSASMSSVIDVDPASA